MKNKPLKIIGWRERASLPDLGITNIVFKSDTGAKTSSLHAFDIELYKKGSQQWVRFNTNLKAPNDLSAIKCDAKVVDFREITTSSGHTQVRPVIKTCMILGDIKLKIELTLSDRSQLRYKMLLGRRAMRNRLIVNPSKFHIINQN